MSYRLTREMRRETCIHEAAHAVVFAMGGSAIYRLAVAPVGATEWTIESRKGAIQTDLWGTCQSSDLFGMWFLRWQSEEAWYQVLKQDFNREYAATPGGTLRSARAEVRKSVCGLLAGPLSKAILHGEPQDFDAFDDLDFGFLGPSHDLTKAHALARLLHWRNEFELCATFTDGLLRRSDVWNSVVRIADVLETMGDVEDVDDLLPEPLARSHWERGWRANAAKGGR